VRYELRLTSELVDAIFHDKDSGILFASFKYVGYNYAGDSAFDLFLSSFLPTAISTFISSTSSNISS